MIRPVPQPGFWQRRSAGRAPPPIERRTHIAIADLLRIACRPGWWWSHIPSGEYRTDKTGALLQRMGLRRSMSDFLFVGPAGQHCWLELKRGRAPLTGEQEAFTEHLHQCGVPYHVARDYQSAVNQLKEWGVL
jgi:hypothetical protein